MRVRVERLAGRCVAEAGLHHLDAFAKTDEQRRIEVAQVVEGGPSLGYPESPRRSPPTTETGGSSSLGYGLAMIILAVIGVIGIFCAVVFAKRLKWTALKYILLCAGGYAAGTLLYYRFW